MPAFWAIPCVLVFGIPWSAQAAESIYQAAVLIAKAGLVEFKAPGRNWEPASAGMNLGLNFQLRTGPEARATLRLADGSGVNVSRLALLEILPPPPRSKTRINLLAGLAAFFTRNKPGETSVKTPRFSGGNTGTEFLIAVDPATGRVVLTVVDGSIATSNEVDAAVSPLIVSSGQTAIFEAGQAPRVTAFIYTTDIVQWFLYYPAVVDAEELGFSPVELARLQDSLSAYRDGDILRALEVYSPGREPQSDAELLYHAALVLASGQVDQTEAELRQVAADSAASRALRTLIAAVKLQSISENLAPKSASEWLAQSYLRQAEVYSSNALIEALKAARSATEVAPRFGFAWERVAELEFSLGHAPQASKALDKSLALAPNNAQAWALKGFLLSANNRYAQAMQAFDRAIHIDGFLANAWLGRGLCQIRQGRAEAGRLDLQMAAALEPNRSVLRSYLGKAFANANLEDRAEDELSRAVSLDPKDPTPRLYSALMSRQQNRINDAIRELELSVRLNDNRRLYRSRFLLDEDRAVRSAQLAAIYQSGGLTEVSVREAARAVDYDYANYSAHLFLADSFNALRDPKRVNLRYETAWSSERLLANLLAPVGSGSLSRHVSQQEYSRLFETDRLGLSFNTEYSGDGEFRQIASQFGTVRNLSYSLDLEYLNLDGYRANNQQSRLEWVTQAKQQLTSQDSIFLQAIYQDATAGDIVQRYDPSNARATAEFSEFQDPIVLAGYHREWGPGVHTLLLAGRLVNDVRASDQGITGLVFDKNTNAMGQAFIEDAFFGANLYDLNYRSQFEAYSFELNQIVQRERNILIVGGRFNTGRFKTHNRLSDLSTELGAFDPLSVHEESVSLERRSVYAYDTLKFLEGRLLFTGGLVYDHLKYPENFRNPPVNSSQGHRERVSPKAALTWSPANPLTLRGVYTRSLGGVSFDESIRLEPTQLAGFNQAFRSVIPESIVGGVSAAAYETWGAAMDLKLKPDLYMLVQGEIINAKVARAIGVFDFDVNTGESSASATPESLDYEERSVLLSLNKLISSEWAVGTQYRFTQSRLRRRLSAIPPAQLAGADPFPARTDERGDLLQVNFQILYNHASGFFSRVDALWYAQENSGYAAGRPELNGANFQQLNLYAGFRLARQRGEIALGLLNVTDQDYQLNPLTPYLDLPHERAIFARLKFNF